MRYSRLFGDTSRFAVRVQLLDDPAPPAGIDAALRDTWGTWELWVDGRCLTRSEQRGTYRDDVEWYLLPLLRWLDDHAVALLNEEPFPAQVLGDAVPDASSWLLESLDGPPLTPQEGEEDAWFEARYGYWQRHAFPAVGSGAVWPNVALRRLADDIEISWDNERVQPARADLRFTEGLGSCLVPAPTVATVLRECVSEVVQALRATSSFHGLLANGASTPTDSWRYLVAPSLRDIIAEQPGLDAVRRKLEALSSPGGALLQHTLLTSWLRAIPVASAEAIVDLDSASSTVPTSQLDASARGIRRRTHPARVAPWKEGYRRALEVREALGWGADPVPELLGWMKHHGFETREDAAALGCDCGVAQFEADRARVTVYRAGALSAPMKRATALGHFVMDMPDDGVAGVVSSAWTHWPSAARAKAFAAMLLMPETAVREIRRSTADATSCTRKVMSTFGVPAEVATWHLFHLRLIRAEERAEAFLAAERWKA